MGNEQSDAGIAIKNSTDQRIFVVQSGAESNDPFWWGAVEPG